MKKVLYTLLAVSIVFAACKKEDEVITQTVVNGCTDANADNYNSSATTDDGTCTYSIIGTWTPTSVDKDSSMTTTIAGEIVYELDFGNGPEVLTSSGSETLTPEEADMEGDVEFTADGKFISDNDTSTYIYSNNVLTITDEEGTNTLECTVTATNISIIFEMSMDTAFNEPMLMMLGFANGDVTSSSYIKQTIHCTRTTVVNTNVSQRVGESNHSWFLKPEINNIIENIKR